MSLLTPREVAAELRIAHTTVLDLIARGDLLASKINSRAKRPSYRVSRDAIDAYLRRGGTVQAPAAKPKGRRRKLPPVRKYFA